MQNAECKIGVYRTAALGSPYGRAVAPQGVTERAKVIKQPSPPTESADSVGTSPKGGGKAASPQRNDKL